MTFEEAAALMIRGGKTKEIDITKNGDYTITDEEKAEGYMGYNPVHVKVTPNLTTITITKNGEYGPPSGYDGYSKVIANVSSTASIQELTVTEPGIYNAVDYGCNGFDPVIVSDIYKQLYEQAVGNGENVTDDNGNEIPNAVTSDDIDELNEYMKHIEFGPYGGSVASQGLDGDTSFKFEMCVDKYIYAGNEIRYTTTAKITVTNLLTGQTSVSTSNGYQTASSTQPPYKINITEVIQLSRQWIQISYNYVNPETGEIRPGGNRSGQATSVGGTAFINSKSWASTVSQKSEPDSVTDYT